MRQRNDTGHVQDVMAWPTDEHPELRPFTAAPGEVVDRPVLLAGFTLLEPPADDERGLSGQGSDGAAEAAERGTQAAAETTARGSRRAKSAATAAEGSQS